MSKYKQSNKYLFFSQCIIFNQNICKISMISYSNTGNETIDQSINAISYFAQRVHDSISYLHTSIQDNIDVISEVTAFSLTDIDTRLKKIEEILAYYK